MRKNRLLGSVRTAASAWVQQMRPSLVAGSVVGGGQNGGQARRRARAVGHEAAM